MTKHKLEVDEALSHKVDFFYKGDEANLGLEIEWNSKVLARKRHYEFQAFILMLRLELE